MTSSVVGPAPDAADRVRWYVEGVARSNSWWSAQARFVLMNGGLFLPVQRPPCLTLGEPKQCYVNAAYAALDSDYGYCEGLAVTGAHVVSHAWVTRRGDDAIDVSWTDPGLAYFGVTLAPRQLSDAIAAAGEAFGPTLDWLVAHHTTQTDDRDEPSPIRGERVEP